MLVAISILEARHQGRGVHVSACFRERERESLAEKLVISTILRPERVRSMLATRCILQWNLQTCRRISMYMMYINMH